MCQFRCVWTRWTLYRIFGSPLKKTPLQRNTILTEYYWWMNIYIYIMIDYALDIIRWLNPAKHGMWFEAYLLRWISTQLRQNFFQLLVQDQGEDQGFARLEVPVGIWTGYPWIPRNLNNLLVTSECMYTYSSTHSHSTLGCNFNCLLACNEARSQVFFGDHWDLCTRMPRWFSCLNFLAMDSVRRLHRFHCISIPAGVSNFPEALVYLLSCSQHVLILILYPRVGCLLFPSTHHCIPLFLQFRQFKWQITILGSWNLVDVGNAIFRHKPF